MRDEWMKPWVTALLLTIPIAVFMVYIFVGVMYYRIGLYDLFLTRKNASILTLTLSASLMPYSIREYLRQRFIASIENEIPVFLSTVEAGLIAGMSIYLSYEEAAKQVKVLGSLMRKVLRGVRAGSEFNRELEKHVPADTYLLRVFREYLELLVIGGEELYKTMTDIRKLFEKFVVFKSTLRSNANQAAIVFLTILGVFVAVLVMVVKMFLEGMTNTEIVSINPRNVEMIESIGSYMILIQAIGSGITLSTLSGSNRNHMLLHTMLTSIIGLIAYTYTVL